MALGVGLHLTTDLGFIRCARDDDSDYGLCILRWLGILFGLVNGGLSNYSHVVEHHAEPVLFNTSVFDLASHIKVYHIKSNKRTLFTWVVHLGLTRFLGPVNFVNLRKL